MLTNINDKHKILSTVSLYHAFNDGAVVVIPLLFPIFKTLFNLSYTQIGIITGGGLIITLFSQLVIGRISDKKNSRTLLSTGMLLLSGSMLMFTWTQGFFTLVFFIFILRFSSSFYHPIGIGLISRTFKKDRLDWAMGIQSALGDFGAFIAILTTLSIAERLGWIIPFYLWSVLGIGCLFIGLYLTRNTAERYLLGENKIVLSQTLIEVIAESVDTLKRFKFLIPPYIISGSSWGITITYLPLFLDDKTTLTLPLIGIIVSLWIGTGTIACLFYGKIQTYLDRKTIIISTYLTMGLMGFLLSVSTDLPIILSIIIILGISTFLTFPALFSFVSEATTESTEGKTFGYIFTIQLGGGAMFLFLCGVLSDLFGIWIPFLFLGISSFMVGVIISRLQKNIVI
jgi:FSR family fosmidomycin resistance protein-like MFS transporter